MPQSRPILLWLPLPIGPGLYGTSENPQNANFAYTEFSEVRRSMARPSRWARYHEREEAVGRDLEQVKHGMRGGKSRNLPTTMGRLA
jgi:hypothetical protein